MSWGSCFHLLTSQHSGRAKYDTSHHCKGINCKHQYSVWSMTLRSGRFLYSLVSDLSQIFLSHFTYKETETEERLSDLFRPAQLEGGRVRNQTLWTRPQAFVFFKNHQWDKFQYQQSYPVGLPKPASHGDSFIGYHPQ